MEWYKPYNIETFDSYPMYANPSNERKNLLANLNIYGVAVDGVLTSDFMTEYYNTPETSTLITDGSKAQQLVYSDPAFFHFSKGSGRTVTFKLPALSAIDTVTAYFFRQDDVSCRLPRRYNVRISPDGKNWMRIVKERGITSNDSPMIVKVEHKFDKPYKALYINFEFNIQNHVWVENFEAWGTESVANAIDITPEVSEGDTSARVVNKYPDYADFLGIHNTLLYYNCFPIERYEKNKGGIAGYDQILPYVAYLDKNGNIKDKMFDSFLFLPYSCFTYSKWYKCADGWKYYIDNTFDKDGNIGSLEKAVADVGKALGENDYKVTVFFSVLHTCAGYGDHPEKFGSFDGGKDLDVKHNLEDRKTAIKWCIDETLKRYKAGDYKHVECKGFYWFEEDINYSDALELEGITFAKEYLHSLGLKLFWIPYYLASGYEDWKENGFDIACMQPNYAFRKETPIERLYDNAQITKALGMCVEMEIGGVEPWHIQKFTDYMDAGAETGYMNSIKMYYQGGVPGEFYKACHSDDAVLRGMYDDLYLFVNEKYVSKKK